MTPLRDQFLCFAGIPGDEVPQCISARSTAGRALGMQRALICKSTFSMFQHEQGKAALCSYFRRSFFGRAYRVQCVPRDVLISMISKLLLSTWGAAIIQSLHQSQHLDCKIGRTRLLLLNSMWEI